MMIDETLNLCFCYDESIKTIISTSKPIFWPISATPTFCQEDFGQKSELIKKYLTRA